MLSLFLFLFLKLSETEIVNYYLNILRFLTFCFFKKFLFIYPVKNLINRNILCVSLSKLTFDEKSIIILLISIKLLCNFALKLNLKKDFTIGNFFELKNAFYYFFCLVLNNFFLIKTNTGVNNRFV
jgi:hypothetical protein